eukprot:3949638-Lingulodinium_polyedra.AAC.1
MPGPQCLFAQRQRRDWREAFVYEQDRRLSAGENLETSPMWVEVLTDRQWSSDFLARRSRGSAFGASLHQARIELAVRCKSSF